MEAASQQPIVVRYDNDVVILLNFGETKVEVSCHPVNMSVAPLLICHRISENVELGRPDLRLAHLAPRRRVSGLHLRHRRNAAVVRVR